MKNEVKVFKIWPLIAVIGVLTFLVVSSVGAFRDSVFSFLYPSHKSFALEGNNDVSKSGGPAVCEMLSSDYGFENCGMQITALPSPILTSTQGSSESLGNVTNQISDVAVTTTRLSALIRWNTPLTSTSQVFYGTKSSDLNLSTDIDKSRVNQHIVDLNNLTPQTKYFYKIVSVDSEGQETWSKIYAFTTAKK